MSEPVVPPVCAVVTAQLSATGSGPSSAGFAGEGDGGFAPADEAKLDTARLQAAIDGCKASPEHKLAVELKPDGARNAFLSGPLELRPGVTLLVDRGATLFGSRDPKLYQTPGSAAVCGTVDDKRGGCRPLIFADHATGAAIMGDGVIDGRGGAKLLVNGTAAAKSWWDLANDARAGGNQEVPRLIIMNGSDDFTLYRITLRNSAMFHVTYSGGDGFTVWGIRIDTPANARNTDGVDPGASKNITVTRSWIRTGDDNIAIKGGSGPVTNMSVADNHFYYGHGMSIGSETNAGVSALRVTHLSLDGTTSGIRIKSNPTRGGLVQDVVYDDVCIRDSKTPIDLDTAYTYPGAEANKLPVFRDIRLHDVRIEGGGKVKLNGYDATHRIGIAFDGVTMSGAGSFTGQFADVMLGPGPVVMPAISGKDVTVQGKAGKGSPASCEAMFAPWPK